MSITLNGTTGITTPALDTSGDVTFADNDKAVFGAGSDLQIYHIADTGNLIQGQSTYGNIDIMSHSTRILDNGSNVMADFSTSGSSSRLFNGADGLKLATTATGIDVTGTIIASNISDGTTSVASTYVVNGSAKAWVNFNGQGTIAIRGSLNVSSITDIAVGYYGHAYTSNFSGQDYSAQGTCADLFYGSMVSPTALPLSSGFNVYTHGQNQTLYDPVYIGIESTGELA